MSAVLFGNLEANSGGLGNIESKKPFKPLKPFTNTLQ